MNTIGVDPAYSETRNKKTQIVREMQVEETNGGEWTLKVLFQCPEDEANALRTGVSSFINNMTLVC